MDQEANNVQDPDRSQPPGTFQLIQGNNAQHAITLDPIPSEDPNDPLNWSVARKAYNFGLVLAVTAAIFTALTIQIIFWQLIGPDLKVTRAQLNNAVSINFVGLATGCAFFIPLTKKYGRRSTYILSTAVIAATTLWSYKMKSLTELYLTNLFQGLAGATNETISMMTVADLFFVHQRGTMNALYLSMVMIGSSLAPIAAGVQATNHGWRSSYLTLSCFCAGLCLLFIFTYEETKYIPIAHGLSREISNGDADIPRNSLDEDKKEHPVLETPLPAGAVLQPITKNTWRQRLRWTTPTSEPLWRLFYFPFVVLISYPHVFYTAFQYAAGIAWLTVVNTSVSITFSAPPYNFNAAQIGYMGTGMMVGNVIGAFYAGLVGDYAIVWLAKRNKGFFEPEMRLYLIALPAVVQAAGLIMFGVTADRGMHWIYPSIGSGMFGFGLGSISDAAMTMIIDAYKEMTGEAFVGVAFLRNAVSIGIPFSITPWMNSMSLKNMFLVCGFVSFFISSTFLIFVFFGKKIRIALAPKYYDMLRKEGSLGRMST